MRRWLRIDLARILGVGKTVMVVRVRQKQEMFLGDPLPLTKSIALMQYHGDG
jgi:hypothetical protein